VLAGLIALVAAVPSAAQVGSGRIAWAGDGTGIHTVAADGSDPVTLKSGNAGAPRWSPDGSKLAFIQISGRALKVMNADGTGEHVVATDPSQDMWLGRQPWSPDGSRIAWGPEPGQGGDIYTASAAGGDVRRITTDGRPKEPPEWSPAGPQLVYASSMPDPTVPWQLFLARDDASTPVPITPGTSPSWSPNGILIAFLRDLISPSQTVIYAIHPDGTGLRFLLNLGWNPPPEDDSPPAWSPDSSKVAYDFWVAEADGSGAQRLSHLGYNPASYEAPTWSPDGDRILFRFNSYPYPIPYPYHWQLVTTNGDGTCLDVLATSSPIEFSWQAVPGGPALGRKTCPSALSLAASSTPNEDGSAISIHATLSNEEGTEPLRDVMLTISAPGHGLSFDLSGSGCTRQTEGLFCEIDPLGAGESRELVGLAMARRVGLDQDSRAIPLRVELHVTALGVSGPMETYGELYFTPSRCSALDPGTGGGVYGTAFGDQICGRRGADEIHPGRGEDYVAAGAGRDVIYARDKNRDVISCGRGRDLVFADRKDKVSRDCERVRRRP